MTATTAANALSRWGQQPQIAENGIAYVYDFGRSGASVVDPAATFDGWTLNYEYTYSDWLTLVGTVNFPEAETE